MDTLANNEAKKYRALWKREEYRDTSTGIPELTDVLKRYMKIPKGSTAYDFGCGEGYMVDYLNNRGIDTVGIDLVGVHAETVVATLWDLPSDLEPREYGLCFDVLECLPTDRVAGALASISGRVTKEAWFRIALAEDHLGSLVGKILHQTVKPIGWWRNQLTAHFKEVRIGQPSDTYWMWAHVRQ
jgi:hypothetical protein